MMCKYDTEYRFRNKINSVVCKYNHSIFSLLKRGVMRGSSDVDLLTPPQVAALRGSGSDVIIWKTATSGLGKKQ